MQVKTGIKTTEWWGTVCVILGTVLASIEGHLPPEWAAIAAAIAAGFYAVGRGLAKRV
jgi:hypothetical protein